MSNIHIHKNIICEIILVFLSLVVLLYGGYYRFMKLCSSSSLLKPKWSLFFILNNLKPLHSLILLMFFHMESNLATWDICIKKFEIYLINKSILFLIEFSSLPFAIIPIKSLLRYKKKIMVSLINFYHIKHIKKNNIYFNKRSLKTNEKYVKGEFFLKSHIVTLCSCLRFIVLLFQF
jgi:hypothetical protein